MLSWLDSLQNGSKYYNLKAGEITCHKPCSFMWWYHQTVVQPGLFYLTRSSLQNATLSIIKAIFQGIARIVGNTVRKPNLRRLDKTFFSTHTIVVLRVWLDCAWVSPWSIDWAQDNHKCLHKIEVEVVLFPEEMAETIHCFDGSIKTLLEIEDRLNKFQNRMSLKK